MNTLGSRIAHYRKLAGLSQGALAKACGWASQSRVGNYEMNTREPSLDDIAVMAKVVGAPVEALLLGEGNGNVADIQQPHRDAKEYPLISWVAAGSWEESCDNFQPGDAINWVASHEVAGSHGYWLEVDGESMISQSGRGFPPGELILVQPEGFDVISGKLYIAKLISTGETTFKQYVRDAGVEYLRPLNPAFKTIEFDDNVFLIGRVIDSRPPRSLF